MGRRRNTRQVGSLRRPTGTRDLPPVLIVVCEGGTEATILDALRARWHIPSSLIVVRGSKGVPRTVVEVARQAAASGKRGVGSPNVFVVFDHDEHPCFAQAVGRARDLGFTPGYSVPCIELWGLLLHRDQTAPLTHHAAQRALRDVHPGYDHTRHPYLDVDLVERHLDDARRRATALRARNDLDDEPDRNPVTWFDEVVEALRGLRRE